LKFVRTDSALHLNLGGREVLRYQLKRPASGGPSVESGCYIHPLTTPSGTVVTDVAPADHRHHRGVFLGWVEMHGRKDADFWGWGEPAPTRNRRIANRTLEAPPPVLGFPRFRAVNEWLADGQTLAREDLRVVVILRDGATILDIAVQIAAESELTLARWGFGGFAMRTRKDGEVIPVGPQGVIRRAPPRHTEPESNWPDVQWYGLHLKLRDGKQATVAVVSRQENPPTTWHVVPAIGLINPSITAKGPIQITRDKPLVLRYRVMAFDGAPNLEALNRLGDSWYRGVQQA
jgi:hypothetical protein